jgi:colanic acid/amylovoran biosynthesis glycosyltransferase
MQIPCVATWITGIPELIQDGVDGLLVPPSDVAQLAAAIARLIDDPGPRLRLADSARCAVIQCYCLTQNSQNLANVFEKRLSSAVDTGKDIYSRGV